MSASEVPVDLLSEAAAALAQEHDLEAELSKARLVAVVTRQTSEVAVGLGRFDVSRCLGRGGMGKVFEARDRVHGVRLALKVLHVQADEALGRLKGEFRALAEVSHPNLVAMHELHVERGMPFITMDMIDGVSLQSHLRDRSHVNETFVRDCLRQLAQALTALHASAIIHGDIKPSNMLIRPDGALIVVDFGLARTLGEPTHATGCGTPAYMAPERVQEHSPGPPSDWYSVGAVLRELLERIEQSPSTSGTHRLGSLRKLCAGLLDPEPGT